MTTQLGTRAGFEALKHKQPLAPLLHAALQARDSQAGADLLGGLLNVLCIALDACQSSGVAFQWTNSTAKQIAEALPQARRLFVAAVCQRIDQDVADILSELSGAIYEVRDQVTVSEPAEPEAPAAPATTPEPAESPIMRVQIVAMPDRSTDTDILRRGGAIVGSTAIERDA